MEIKAVRLFSTQSNGIRAVSSPVIYVCHTGDSERDPSCPSGEGKYWLLHDWGCQHGKEESLEQRQRKLLVRGYEENI